MLGGRGLTDCKNCLIVDMGGTTTDISIVQENSPAMTGGIRIGGWRTQIKGVFIDTFGLGGDSRIMMKDNKIELSDRRVLPLCVAAVSSPQIKEQLIKLLEQEKFCSYPLHEFLYLVSPPKDISKYDSYEVDLIKRLEKGMLMLGSDGVDIYKLKSERLEDEGVVMRCGLTPTDIMHIKGDFSLHDTEVSVLAARYFLNTLSKYTDNDMGLNSFCEDIYDEVCRKLYENIVRILFTNKFPKLFEKSMDDRFCSLISQSWFERNEEKKNKFFDFGFDTIATLVGIGAPTHIFLPAVAKALNTNFIIPENAEVANAVGAIIADVSAKAEVGVFPNYAASGTLGYTVLTQSGNKIFDSLEEAVEAAKVSASFLALDEAKKRGALGELSVETTVHSNTGYAKGGGSVDLGTTITAVAAGRIEL